MTTVAPATRDSSALFSDSSITAVLHVTKVGENPADLLTRSTLDAEAPGPASATTARTPHTERHHPASLAETRRRLEVLLLFPPMAMRMPVYEWPFVSMGPSLHPLPQPQLDTIAPYVLPVVSPVHS